MSGAISAKRANERRNSFHLDPPWLFFVVEQHSTPDRPRESPICQRRRLGAGGAVWPQRTWPFSPVGNTAGFHHPHRPIFPGRAPGPVVSGDLPGPFGLTRDSDATGLADRQGLDLIFGIAKRRRHNGTRSRAHWCRRRWRRAGASARSSAPSARASEAPSSGFTTSRLVSPNSSCWSQNGGFSPPTAPR